MNKTTLIIGAVLAAAGIIIVPILIALAAVIGFIYVTENSGETDPCLVDPIASAGTANTGKRYRSGEELAATIYTQAHGLGFGNLGAVAAIAGALSETNGASAASLPDVNIKNGTIGDTVTSNAHLFRGTKTGNATSGDMTDSRGIYQQRASWAPRGTAWSGQPFTYATSRSNFSDRNPLTGDKAPMWPWVGGGWANSDPRMNPAQATNLFLLGGAGGQEGLEEALRKDKRIKRINDPVDMPAPEQFTATEIGAFVQDVQVSAHPDKAGAFVPRATELVRQIEAGEIPTPAFQPPDAAIARAADSSFVRAALGQYDYRTATNTGGDVATPDIVGDGATIIGDSVLKHMWGVVGKPETLFGGDTQAYGMVGISLGQVLSGEERTAPDGSRDLQGRKATPTSEWLNAIATGPSRVIVELGTNQGGTREQVDQFMNIAGPDRDVYWLSQHYDRSQYFNDVLLEASRDYPNLTVVDISDLITDPRKYHPWEGAGKDPSKAMWERMLETVSGSRVPTANLSLACGGSNIFASNINAPTPEAAEAVAWALAKARAGTRYVAGANAGNAAGTSFDCSTFTYTSFSQAGLPWRMQTSSYQWADTRHIQLIPMVDPVTGELNAQPGDLVWTKWSSSGGDGMAAGHVALIVDTSGDSPTIVGAENPDSGVRKYSAAGYINSGVGFLKKEDPNAPVSASGTNTGYSKDWRDAWVGRIVVPA